MDIVEVLTAIIGKMMLDSKKDMMEFSWGEENLIIVAVPGQDGGPPSINIIPLEGTTN